MIAVTSAFILSFIVAGSETEADSDIDHVRGAVIRRAAAAVAPALVRIETTGGAERIGRVQAGVTTGIIVAPDGWIVSSLYAFSNRPAGILVHLPDNSTVPARLVSHDYSRGIVLLKVESSGLNVPLGIDTSEIRVGQSVIAIGNAWGEDSPTMSAGIVSALNRIGGRAIQTDAKTSPANYGGPLLDLRGQVLGILVPLDPTGKGRTSGAEWYDSGIGFAIPWEEVLTSLPMLKEKDIHSGLAGISLRQNESILAEPIIEAIAWRSPAELAGLEPGDRVVKIEGRTVDRNGQIRQWLGSKHASDQIDVVVERSGMDKLGRLTLAASLPTYRWPILGFLGEQTKEGVLAREIYPGTPAAQAGLSKGDIVLAADHKPVAGPEALRRILDGFEVGETIRLTVKQEKGKSEIKLPIESWPEELPLLTTEVDLPGGREESRTVTGSNIPYWIYLPSARSDKQPPGMVLYFEGPQSPNKSVVLSRWNRFCNQANLVLVGVRPQKKETWTPADLGRTNAILNDVLRQESIDEERIIVHGALGSNGIAEQVAQRERRRVRGLVLMGAASLPLGPTHPDHRLALALFWPEKDSRASTMTKLVRSARENGYPTIGGARQFIVGTYPAEDVIEEIARWSVLLGSL